MFARPNIKKGEQKKRPTIQKSSKKAGVSHQKQQLESSHTINKMASIRTLPPFAYINSDSGTNSQNKSLECSDTHSQIWRQQSQLFETDHKDTIKDLDKQLQDVLETIKKERNFIDMKIWKLRSKFQQKYDRTSRKSITKNNNTLQKSECATSTRDNEPAAQPSSSEKKQHETQFPEPVSFSSYFKELSNTLGLTTLEEPSKQIQQEIKDEVKIEENKIILQMLFDKISKI